MDISSRRRTFIERSLAGLADSLGFHPVEIVLPELAPFAELAPNVLLRRNPEGYWQMLALVECDSPRELAEKAEQAADFAVRHAGLTGDKKLRISLVGIGLGTMARAGRRRLLAETRLLEDRLVIRRFYVSLDRRRMHAFHSPWSFAPGFEINPCDPDENLLVELVRRDRYLKEAAGHTPTDEEHLASLTKERAFLAGLSGRRVLVRTILAINVLVWLALELTGGSMSAAQLLRAGAKSNGLILAGQYWRFVTPIFLHVGLVHLVINSAGLLFLGNVLERIYGSMQLALIYFVAGVASVVASFYLGQEMMAGASGAIFGLAGALVVYGFRYRKRIPARFGAMFGGGLLPLIGLNIGFGLFVKGIDNWAHLGGLVAGAAVTLFLRPLADEVTPTTWLRVRRVAALSVLGVVVGATALAAHNFVRYGSIYDTDLRWAAKKEIPGGLEIRLPASWAEVKRDNETVVFRATGYEAWLEARAVDVSKDTNRVVLGEFARLQREGFPLPGPWPYSGMALLNELCARGRAETTMAGPKGAQRRQTFLLVGNTLVSLGVVTPEKTPVRFAPVLDHIFDSLPEPE